MVSRRKIGSQTQRSLRKGGFKTLYANQPPSQMIFASVTQIHVFNVKVVVVAALHQEELSVIMQLQTSRRFV